MKRWDGSHTTWFANGVAQMVYHRRTCVCSTPPFRSSTIKFLFVLFCNCLFYLFPGLNTTTKTFCIFDSFCKLWSHITSLSTGFFLEPSTISLAQCEVSYSLWWRITISALHFSFCMLLLVLHLYTQLFNSPKMIWLAWYHNSFCFHHKNHFCSTMDWLDFEPLLIKRFH